MSPEFQYKQEKTFVRNMVKQENCDQPARERAVPAVPAALPVSEDCKWVAVCVSRCSIPS